MWYNTLLWYIVYNCQSIRLILSYVDVIKMSELSDMFADQFKRWLIHNGEENKYGYYLSISKIIDLRFLDGIKEQNVFEVTNPLSTT